MAAAGPQVATPPAADARPRAEVLRLADGIELIGHFEGSGFKKPPLLARRADGQMIQLTKPLYAIAALSDGRRDAHAVAEILTQASNRRFSAADVQTLVEKRLRPVGVLALADGTSPQVPKREPLMALRHRRPLLSERGVNVLARPFTWLHQPLVAVAVVLGLIAFDVWLFAFHGLAGGLRSALYNPVLLLAVVASVVVATAFHEIGHASACRYSGGRPGVMGVGFYLVYPAFYCDVTDAYRLNRSGRLRTDLGGVYFNGIFALLAGGVFFATGEETALLAAAVQHLTLLQQLLPLMRFDGYYVLTDLTGVPDILSRIKPIFRSLVPGRDREPQVAELKPWVRVAVTAYLATLVPTLFFLFAWMLMGVPRIVATVHDSFWLQLDRFQTAEGIAEAGVAVVGILSLVLPVAAMTLSITRVSRMVGRGLVRWAHGSAPRTVAAVVAAAAVIGAVAYMWWPNGEYEPIRPGERGTIGEALMALPDAPDGRPLFTPEDAVAYASVSNKSGGSDASPERRVDGDDRSPDGRADADGRMDDSVADPGVGGTDGSGATPSPTDGTTTAPTTTTEPTPTPAPTPTDTTSTTTTPETTTTGTTPEPSTTEPAPSTTEPAPSTTEPAPSTTEPAPSTTETTSDSSTPTTTDGTTTTTTAP